MRYAVRLARKALYAPIELHRWLGIMPPLAFVHLVVRLDAPLRAYLLRP